MVAEAPQAAAARADGGALNQLIWGFANTQAVYVTAKLGIVDTVRSGPQTAQAIADVVGAHEPSLRRLLRALTTIGILVEDQDGRFAATPMGELLRSDHPRSVRAFAICLGDPLVWRPWGELIAAVKTGATAFEQVYGETFFTHLSHELERATVFDAAMTSVSQYDAPAILAAYDFTDCRTIVDVGGGHGALLRALLDVYPQANGVLFDLLPVVTQAQTLSDAAAAGRCSFVGGDMFRAIPAGGDTYILKSILHDWSDAQALQILRNCRQAIVDHGRLLTVELLLAPPNGPDFAKWLDLNMLALMGGRERSEAEFRALYAEAGFELTRIVPTGERVIIEGVPS
jgi:hypothetical protein